MVSCSDPRAQISSTGAHLFHVATPSRQLSKLFLAVKMKPSPSSTALKARSTTKFVSLSASIALGPASPVVAS